MMATSSLLLVFHMAVSQFQIDIESRHQKKFGHQVDKLLSIGDSIVMEIFTNHNITSMNDSFV